MKQWKEESGMMTWSNSRLTSALHAEQSAKKSSAELGSDETILALRMALEKAVAECAESGVFPAAILPFPKGATIE